MTQRTKKPSGFNLKKLMRKIIGECMNGKSNFKDYNPTFMEVLERNFKEDKKFMKEMKDSIAPKRKGKIHEAE